ncbi:hypothetical protein D3C71_1405700 [compost metagenome]
MHGTALGEILHPGGIAETFMAGDRPVDDIEEIGADLVCTTTLSGMTARTLLEDCFALGGIGAGKQLRDRRRRGSGFTATRFAAALCRSNGETFLFGRRRMENALRRNRHRHQDENRAKQRPNAHIYIRIHLYALPRIRLI